MAENLINCLKNERIIVRFLPKENAMAGNNPRHPIYGGMADTSKRIYVVPMLRTGQLTDVLTKSEKEFLESYLGMEDNGLSVYKTENNFWKKFKVILYKNDNVLDLSQGLDYIKYKVLLANKNLICPDLETLQDRPKSTYEYVMISEGTNTSASKTKMDFKKEAYTLYGKMENDRDTMRVIVETLTRRPVANSTKADSLAVQIDELIERDVKSFLKVAKDELLPTKVLIRNGIEAGIIANRGGLLYLRDNGNDSPLCENGDPTMNVAATYLNMPKHSEIKQLVEAKVNQYKGN